MAETTRHLLIHGYVQGVFYRAWSADLARELGLTGWVRNRRDGSVEMLLHGEEESVRRMIGRCREGPPAARVDRIDESESNEPSPTGFEKRSTI